MTPPTRSHGSHDSETPSRDSDENLTVVVFRQNDASRSFQVSLSWIRQLGWLSGGLVLATVIAMILTLRFYREAKIADPSRVQELERDLKDLRLAYSKLESRSGAPASPLPQQAGPIAQAPSPAPAVTAPPAPVAVIATEPAGMPFTLFPGGTQAIPAPDSRPIQISQPRTSVAGRTVRAKFAFQYVADDQGSQQGRFVLLARGADSIHVYPEGALGTGTAGSLILPDKGEYFSVSRYREVNAEFSVGARGAMPSSIEVFVFTTDGKLYMHQTLPITSGTARNQPAPKAKKEPAPNAVSAGATPAPAQQPPASGAGAAGTAADKPAGNPTGKPGVDTP